MELNLGTRIKEWTKNKYFKGNEGNGTKHASMEEKLKKDYFRRLYALKLKGKWIQKNLFTYNFNIINWNMNEVRKKHIRIMKIITCPRMPHLKADCLATINLSKNNDNRRMIQLGKTCKTTKD